MAGPRITEVSLTSAPVIASREQPGFCRTAWLARSLMEVMACFLPWLGALAPMQRTYFSDSGIFNCQGTMKGSSYFTLLLTSQREGRKYSIFHKKVHFLCFAQRVYPGYPAMQSWPILTSRRRRQKYKQFSKIVHCNL